MNAVAHEQLGISLSASGRVLDRSKLSNSYAESTHRHTSIPSKPIENPPFLVEVPEVQSAAAMYEF